MPISSLSFILRFYFRFCLKLAVKIAFILINSKPLPKKLILYSTSHCHLCDLACTLIKQSFTNIQLNIVDIADDDALLAQYGTRIPVLHRADTKTELNWPFDATNIGEFLK
jgi:hypothetical protein